MHWRIEPGPAQERCRRRNWGQRALRRIAAGTIVAVVAWSAPAMAGSKPPETVSPGAIGSITRVEASCPTFSWGAVRGAESYELMIYDAGPPQESAGSLQPKVRTVVPGGATAWTPSLGRCLERGRTYAWVIRAVGGGKQRAWSEPRVFTVEAGPSPDEIKSALEILRRYAGQREHDGMTGTDQSRLQQSTRAEPTGLDAAAALEPETMAMGTTALPDPFAVDAMGNVYGTTFFGSGAGLSGVNANLLQGQSAASFSSGTHTHPGLDPVTGTIDPSVVRIGTDASVLSWPIDVQTCSGTEGTTSNCDLNCDSNPPIPGVPGAVYRPVAGGCTSTGGTCAATHRSITESGPTFAGIGWAAWGCTAACSDGGTTGLTGYIICVASFN